MQGSKKRHNWSSRIPEPDDTFTFKVSIPWTGQPEYWWNDACADVLEVFGLPGDRFTSHPQHDNMDFFFKSEKDAALCRILLSEKLSEKVAFDLNKNV